MQNKSTTLFGNMAFLSAKLLPKLGKVFTTLFKTLKGGKVLGAVGSAAAYSYLLTWEFAAMLMIMLFVHESGHVWAMKHQGIKTKGFYFIPLIGGAAVPEESFKTRYNETFIALMGPMWGLSLTFAAFAAFWFTGNPLWASVASWCALINLINLLPINPLDGGRVTKSLALSAESFLATLVMLVLYVVSLYFCGHLGLSLFVFIGVIGAIELLSELSRAGSVLVINPIYYYFMKVVKGVFLLLVFPLVMIVSGFKALFMGASDDNEKEVRPGQEDKAQLKGYALYKACATAPRKLFSELSNFEQRICVAFEEENYSSRESSTLSLELQMYFIKATQLIDNSQLLSALYRLVDILERSTFRHQANDLAQYKQEAEEYWRVIKEECLGKPKMTRLESIAGIVTYFGLVVIFLGVMFIFREYPDVTTALGLLS